MKANYLLSIALMALPLISYAGEGPTNIGPASIGMSKADYISALGITPVNCNDHQDKRAEIKYLHPDIKTLCYDLMFDTSGSSENIQVSGISYDAVAANYDVSEFINSVGLSSKAIFLKERLISIEIMYPKVSLDTLTLKYGSPKLVDNRKVKICKNRVGNEFENRVGNLDAVWANGKVNSILRTYTSEPSETCTDGLSIQYYILEEPAQLKIIENAINKYRADLAEKEAGKNPF